MGKSVGRKIGLAGIVIFVILMLLLSGLCWWLWHCRSTGSAPRVLGYELMSLHGEEMEPEFPDGSLVFLTKVQPQSLKSGDVVVYGRENGQGGADPDHEPGGKGRHFLCCAERGSPFGVL